MGDRKQVELDESVHKRLSHFGKLNETYSDAVSRLMDEAGAPSLEDYEA